MTTQPEPDSLRDQLCDAFIRLIRDYADRSIIAPGYMADTALAVVQPVINEAQQRAEAAEAMTAEVIETLRLANRELDAAATKWDADLDKRTADLTERASNAEAAEAVLREVLAQFTQQGHPGAPCLRTPWIRTPTIERWRAALTPPVPADNPEGGAQ